MIFSKENTCIVLIDVWELNGLQIKELGPAYAAWGHTREKIAELIKVANTNGIPLYFQNHGWPIPANPASLREALLESNVIIDPRVFTKEGGERCSGLQTNSLIRNTVNFRDYENLVYTGYALDACVADRSCGYRNSNTRQHRKYIIKDAGLIQYTLYHGKNTGMWPEYSKVMRACSHKEPLPWKTPKDIIDETIYFCDNFATQFCFSLYLDEFKAVIANAGH